MLNNKNIKPTTINNNKLVNKESTYELMKSVYDPPAI